MPQYFRVMLAFGNNSQMNHLNPSSRDLVLRALTPSLYADLAQQECVSTPIIFREIIWPCIPLSKEFE